MSKPIAFLFPGQGSQSVGMLRALAQDHPQVRETFEEAAEVLHLDLWRLVQEGPAQALDRTDRTQPAMLAAGVAVWRTWKAQGGPDPGWMAGHSLGEFSALVCAGALAFSDGIRLVAQRGALMQEAVPVGEGAMAALLGLDDDSVRTLCREAAQGQVLEPVNFNAPGQVVIAGHEAAVERGIAAARARGAKRAIRLAVSAPSHCALMKPAADRLARLLAEIPIQRPRIPVLHNVSVDQAPDPDGIRDRLRRQLDHPVRWVELIRALAREGVSILIEAGPGKVLTGLTRRIDRRLNSFPVFDDPTLAAALKEVSHVER